MPKPYCRTEAKNMQGHDLPRHEALQQDEATSAAHFRPAVLVPGVHISHFLCTQGERGRVRERGREGERERGWLPENAQMGRACAYIHAVGSGA